MDRDEWIPFCIQDTKEDGVNPLNEVWIRSESMSPRVNQEDLYDPPRANWPVEQLVQCHDKGRESIDPDALINRFETARMSDLRSKEYWSVVSKLLSVWG